MFWVDRWRGSSASYLPLDARGLYREMLSEAWARGANLPNDHEAIRRICRVTEAEWDRCWPQIASHWETRGDLLINTTQLELYSDYLRYYTGKSEAAKLSTPARYSNRNANRNAQGNANGTQTGSRKERGAERERYAGGNATGTGSGSDVRTRAAQNDELDDPRASMAELPTATVPPSRHRGHVYPAACERGVCVYERLHEEFVKKLGGDVVTAQRQLRTFYSDIITAIPLDEPITEDAYVFWRSRFTERFGKPNGRKHPAGETGVPMAPTAEQTRAEWAEEDRVNATRRLATPAEKRAVLDEIKQKVAAIESGKRKPATGAAH